MKAQCHRESLLAAVSAVSSVVPTRSPKPILQSLKLVAGPDSSTLMATDLEVGIRHDVPGVDAAEPGAVILPTQRVQQILRTASVQDLSIATDGPNLVITAGRSTFELPSEDPDTFPDVPGFDATAYHVLPAAAFRRMIRRTIFATDVESTRYALGGALFSFEDGRLALVGTDGRRMAHAVSELEQEGEIDRPAGWPVVPIRALKLLERNLEDEDPPVHFVIQAGNSILFRTGRAVIYSRLLEGRFPRYQDVFPAGSGIRIPFADVPTLLGAIEQAAIVTSDESRSVDFDFGSGLLELSSKAADVGRSRVELPISHDGSPVATAFDPRYLIDALKTLDPGTSFDLELIDNKTAAVLRTGDGYTYVVMPLTRER